MRLAVVIDVDERHLPAELKGWPISEWGTPGVALLTQDGDGGWHTVESVREIRPDDEGQDE